MGEPRFHVRLEGEVLGPLSGSELRDLALRGGISPETPVSHDGATWTRASNVQGLTFRPRLPPANAPPGRPEGGGFSLGWLIGGIAIGGVGVLIAGVGLLIVIGLLSSEQPTGSPLTCPVDYSSSSAMSEQQIIAQKTIAYWRGIGAALAEGQRANQSPEVVVAALRQAAGQIRALPTAEVDPDAVQCGNDAATVVGNLADVIEHSNNPGLLVEAFLRGVAGDPFGTTAEVLDAQTSIRQQLNQVQTELDNARAILSSRYGIELPRL